MPMCHRRLIGHPMLDMRARISDRHRPRAAALRLRVRGLTSMFACHRRSPEPMAATKAQIGNAVADLRACDGRACSQCPVSHEARQ